MDPQSDTNSPVALHGDIGTYSTQNSNQNTARSSLSLQHSDELIGTRFDTREMLNALDDSMNSQRPPPLHSYNTSPDPRSTPTLRHSGGFGLKERGTDPSSPDGTVGSAKRYSDEGFTAKPGLGGRKKSGFSNFMNSMLGSPRNIKISAPENPVHVTHVGYDNVTGQFTVSLLCWGVSKRGSTNYDKSGPPQRMAANASRKWDFAKGTGGASTNDGGNH